MKEEYIYGRNPVIEVLREEKASRILVQTGETHGSINKIIAMAKELNLVVKHVDRRKLEEISGTSAHQGVVAVVGGYEYVAVEDIIEIAEKKGKKPLIVLLDGIEDPHNLGAIIRSCECSGADGVVIPKRRSAEVTPTAFKASAGAAQHLPIAQVANLNNEIKKLKDRGFWIYGADVGGGNYYQTELKRPLAIVIGNEGKGISNLVKENCDFLVGIPVFGKVDSLNASNAAAILLYEVVRQNEEAKKQD